MVAFVPAMAQENPETASGSESAATNYVGDNYRIGIGWDSETDLTGEFFWAFGEQPDSAWIAEGWLGDSAGGLKLNYHWLSGGVQDGVDAAGNPVFTDGKIRKLFIAADQNEFDDAKVSLGFGSERNNRFWSVYGSKSITGDRYLGQSVVLTNQVVTGIINNHPFTRTDTLQTITDFYAHPYDFGVGARYGHYFEDSLLRLQGGLDYEWGDYDTSQATLFAALEKRFADSPHGIALRAEALHKSGDFETDDDDFRVTAFWTFEFGESFRPATAYRDVEVSRAPDPDSIPTKDVVEMVQNRITLENASSFDLDRFTLNPAALDALKRVIADITNTRIVGDIQIVGHTCSLGSDEYNQALSERRAKTVYDFLASHNVDPSRLKWEGHGEREPRYSNDTEESRKQNRRVEITFLAETEVVRQVPVGEGEPVKEWVQEKVPVEAAWIRRALRNPVMHKRSVDYYHYNRVTENQWQGDPVIANVGPNAVNDTFQVNKGSSSNALSVLANDTDPEGDTLTIVSVTNPAHGTVSISGGALSYTPNPGYLGTDMFQYTIKDTYGAQDSATVSVTVVGDNDLPVAVDDFAVTAKNTAVTINVLANDSDPNSDPLTIIGIIQPENKMGTVTINGDGTVTYDPMPGWWGGDSFQYVVSDGRGGEATATVTMDVTAN
jgi:outer membrane protein OmpA-like peptidoglycan-associated protein